MSKKSEPKRCPDCNVVKPPATRNQPGRCHPCDRIYKEKWKAQRRKDERAQFIGVFSPDLSGDQRATFLNCVDSSGEANACWPFLGLPGPDNYGVFRVGQTMVRANRLAYFLGAGPFDANLFVLHTCDNKPCVRAHPDDIGTYFANGTLHPRCGHLWLGNHDDNMADKVSKGRQSAGDENGSRLHPESRPRGEQHSSAKLTESIVLEILQRSTGAWGEQTALAKEFGVGQTLISEILRGTVWRHVFLAFKFGPPPTQ